MDQLENESPPNESYAQTYGNANSDWQGQIDFYRELEEEVKAAGGSVREIACGTGRVTIRLAAWGGRV